MKFIIMVLFITGGLAEDNDRANLDGPADQHNIGGIYDYFQVYIPAINDTLRRLSETLGTEVQKDVKIDIEAALVPIRHQFNETNGKIGSLNGTMIGLNGTLIGLNGTLIGKIESLNGTLIGKMESLNGTLIGKMESLNGKIDYINEALTTKLDYLDGTINKINATLSTKLDRMELNLAANHAALMSEIKTISKRIGDVQFDLHDFKKDQQQHNTIVQQQYLVLLGLLNKTKAETEDGGEKGLFTNLIVKEKM